MRSEPNYQNSVEAYVRGEDHRIFYGVTREEFLVGGPKSPFVELMYHRSGVPTNWDEFLVVTETKRVALGLGRQWTRVTRRYDEYGERLR